VVAPCSTDPEKNSVRNPARVVAGAKKNDDRRRKMETGTTASGRENRRRPSCRKGKSKRKIQINFVVDKSKNRIVHGTSPSKSTHELLDPVATKTEIESTQTQGIMKQEEHHPALNRKVTSCYLARGTRPGPTRGRSNRAERRAAAGESKPERCACRKNGRSKFDGWCGI
jgi:hypothetical protein